MAFRLDPRVRPRRYALRVEVDPARSASYRGEVDITLELAQPTRTLTLHAADLRLSQARLVRLAEDDGDGTVVARSRAERGAITLRPARETAEISFARPIPAGKARLSLRFAGKLRQDLKGLYAARSGERRYAFTQLEAADARRFFPCFDEPCFKASFALSVVTAREHAVVSNAPVAQETHHDDGRKTVCFEATPLLSSYLVALAVGDLVASEPSRCGDTPIRVWHVPGAERLTGFALDTARECLARLEAYFGTPYPYGKLDLVAVPDFEIGAMENAGAVFFRETLLLLDPATASLGEQKRAAEVICHELAHMWYGNLVTMAWWDDLWLNEAFATWMAFHIVDEWKPEWRMWHDYAHSRSAALQADALRNTHPVYGPVHTPSEATENFDLITYEKGAAIVRMLERYLDPRTFRQGVRDYIRTHRESNTIARDLWKALSQASGQNVERMVRAWIEQPGFPLVQLQRKMHDGSAVLELRQAPFSLLGSSARAGKPPRWPVPWLGHVGRTRGNPRLERHLLTRATERIPLPARSTFVYGNADEGGFFRPLHAPDELARLCASLSALAPIERLGLVSHQWAVVQGGYAPIESFLDVVDADANESDPDVLTAMFAPLESVGDRLARGAGEDTAESFGTWLARAFGPRLEALGWDPAHGEDDETRLRRGAILGLLGFIAEVPAVVAEADARCARYLDDPTSLDPNLSAAVVSLGARVGDMERYEAYLARSEQAATPQERRRFRLALGDFRAPDAIERTLALCLTERIPTQDVAFVLIRLLANRAAREHSWAFIKRRWPRLQKRIPGMLVSRVVDATPWLDARTYKRDVEQFFKAHPVPTASRALRQAMERFALHARLQRAAAPGLKRWLAAHVPA